MNIGRVSIRDFRNLESVGIEPRPGLNFILGPNGSGKTSLLEALYLLSRGRSFRTQNTKRLIRIGTDSMSLRVLVEGDEAHATELIDSVCRAKEGRLQFKVSGQRVERATDLARILPVVLLHQDSHLLISSGPKYRRHFLDIGVFHVKPEYGPVWQCYKRALHQRNAALRNSHSNIGLWDKSLSVYAEQLDGFRQEYLNVLGEYFTRLSRELIDIEGRFSLSYCRGWKDDEELTETLIRCRDRDLALGYTRDGPHRADFDIRIEDQPVKDFLSRGQQKLLVYTMFFAQAEALSHFTLDRALILADDLSAEVDDGGVARVVSIMRRICDQAVITNQSYASSADKGSDTVFHVKHGTMYPD